ncbi:MAG TPA: hypothetical protein VMM76_04725 [Pirellulaceae bacterium]|nr:hypothetical protein [Pirellulaceae bacterium]
MNKPPASAVFTLRDLNRQPAKVLDAVRKFGSAEIRTRSGEVFTVAAKAGGKVRSREFPNFEARWKKLRELGLVPPPRTDDERINRIIAGEL